MIARVAQVVVASFASCLATLAQEQVPVTAKETTGFVDKTITVGDTEHRYAVYVPPDYSRERAQRWPLIVFLHGMGECGTDGKRHLDVGLGPAVRADAARWPFVIVFPQKPDRGSQWAEHEAMVMSMLAATEKEYRIDSSRRFLTGLSQGGAGTWALGAKHADRFAAIAPVCGYGKPDEVAAKLERMPIWAFHGADDNTVPAAQSKALCAAVDAARGHAVLTLYERTAHNSWDKAYRESALAEWLRTLPGDRTLARALAEPERLVAFQLQIDSVTQPDPAREPECERITVASPGPDGNWRRIQERHRGAAPIGAPVETNVPAREAEICITECVRLLVRAGVADTITTTPPGGDYVQVDYFFREVLGYGGSSLRAWPKLWKVGDPSAPVEAIRRAVERMRALR